MGLKDLQGALFIQGMEKVIDPTEAKNANLQQKTGLDDLKLEWGYGFHNTTNKDDVIEKLRPHSKLKTLSINGYDGMKFPSWLGDPSFDQLTELVLKNCYNCTELSTLRNLTSLRKLRVVDCFKVVNVESSIMGSLREVTLWNCDAVERYYCPNSVESLDIWSCSSLTSLSFSKLHEELASSYSSLIIMKIRDCKNIKSISQEHMQSLTSLKDMTILNCPSLEDSFPSFGLLWPPNLRKLKIGALKKPMSEWGLLNYPPSLVELVLEGRNSGVVSFGIMEEQNDNHTTSSACFLLPPSLTNLRIIDFKDIKSISEVLQHLPHLQHFHYHNCPELMYYPDTTSSLRVSKF